MRALSSVTPAPGLARSAAAIARPVPVNPD
jgi:hypothetical protein